MRVIVKSFIMYDRMYTVMRIVMYIRMYIRMYIPANPVPVRVSEVLTMGITLCYTVSIMGECMFKTCASLCEFVRVCA